MQIFAHPILLAIEAIQQILDVSPVQRIQAVQHLRLEHRLGDHAREIALHQAAVQIHLCQADVLREYDGAPRDIFQLTDVAGPVIIQQLIKDGIIGPEQSEVIFTAVLVQKEFEQGNDVLRSVVQGRQMEIAMVCFNSFRTLSEGLRRI